jgi:hypothetical protein
MEYTHFKPLAEEPSKGGDGLFARLFRSSSNKATPRAVAPAAAPVAVVTPKAVAAAEPRESVSATASAAPHGNVAPLASSSTKWMPDELVSRCHSCDLSFTALRRRHHCRTCGQIFCNACASNFLTLEDQEVIRVCNQCLQSHNQQQMRALEAEQLLGRDEMRRGLNKSPVAAPPRSTPSPFRAAVRKFSVMEALEDLASDTESRKAVSESEDEQARIQHSFWDDENVVSYPIDRRVSVIAAPHLPTGLDVSVASVREGVLRDESKAHVRAIVASLLERDPLLSGTAAAKEVWLPLLCALAVKATRCVSLRRGKDSLDVTKYVRVKAVSGGMSEESNFVRGLVLSKTVAHKRMRANLEKPRILLMGCAVQFSRPDWKFVAFDVLQAQERDFLRILVDRIATLKPDLLVTSESVSSIALELLMDLGITCVTRVATSALERLARFTGASVVPNLSDIPSAVLGQGCELVRSETLQSLSGRRNFLLFDACPPKRGGTIVLRGADSQVLHALKRILLFAVSTAYHLRLEDAFLEELSLHSLRDTSLLAQAAVSMSPGVVFAPRAPSGVALPVALLARRPMPDLYAVNSNPATPLSLNFDYETVLEGMEHYAATRIEAVDSSDIRNNQSITYCFSRHHSEKRSHCVAYQYHHVDFFSPSDLSLAAFLLWSCDGTPCSVASCGRPLFEHESSFLYGDRRLFVSTTAAASVVALAPSSAVLAWFVCNECQESSEPRTLSHDSLHLSVGKLLELLFLDASLSCSVGHRLNPSGTLVFSSGGRAVSIAFLRTPVYEVEVPAMEQRFNTVAEATVVERELASLAAAAHVAYDVIQRRVDGAMVDVLAKEEGDFLESINEAKRMRLLQINRLYRMLLTNVMRWQGVFEETVNVATAAASTSGVMETPKVSRAPTLTAVAAAPSAGGASEATPSVRRLLTTSTGAMGGAAVSAVAAAATFVVVESETVAVAAPAAKSEASLLGRLIKKTGFGQAVQLQSEIAEVVGNTISKECTMYQLFTGRGAPMPLSPLTNEVVMVLDQEPSSHIACALGTDSYREQIHDILGPMVAASSQGVGTTLDLETMSRDLLVKLSRDMGTGQHPQAIKVAFESMLPRLQYTCDVTIYYPVQFAALRRLFCGGEAAFVHSMARSQRWAAKVEGGGASKAQFVNTMDGLYLLKSVPTVELRNFQLFAQKYFDYLLDAAKETAATTTMLVKIVGVFSIEVKNSHGSLDKQDFIVMEKLFHNRTIRQTFDLKGSVLNRVRPEGSAVLQDENLRRMMWSSPLVVDDVSKGKFARAIWSDTAFLSEVSVMDYSILVGVDDQSGKLVVGIIDYIRPYSWDKHMEYLMKVSIFLRFS